MTNLVVSPNGATNHDLQPSKSTLVLTYISVVYLLQEPNDQLTDLRKSMFIQHPHLTNWNEI
jgi:hypothetical protein